MTTMLEKAARAAEDAYDVGGVDFEGIARAVLMAVRSADDDALEAGCEVGPDTNNGPFSYGDADAVFTAMIDTILGEPETQTKEQQFQAICTEWDKRKG